MKKVIVVSKTHLDLGFTDYAENIRQKYIDKFIPEAIDLAEKVNKDGKKYFAHTLNNTVVAPPRMLIAFLENNLRADGSVAIPEALRPYVGGKDKILLPEKK